MQFSLNFVLGRTRELNKIRALLNKMKHNGENRRKGIQFSEVVYNKPDISSLNISSNLY